MYIYPSSLLHLQHGKTFGRISLFPSCYRSNLFTLGTVRRSNALSSATSQSSSRLQQLRERLQHESTNNGINSDSAFVSTVRTAAKSLKRPRPHEPLSHDYPPPSVSSDTLPFSHPLTDRFGRHHRYLRISLTERCNLRCTYCMPAEGIDLSSNESILTTQELYQLSSLFVSLGIDKIRLTGGEPTLRKDLDSIIDYLSRLHGLRTIAMTTNGITLAKNLTNYIDKGLNQINISLDTLKPYKFEQLSRRPPQMWHRVMDSIYACIDAYQTKDVPVLVVSESSKSTILSSLHHQPKGLKYPLKINTVVIRNINDDEINDFVELTLKYPIQIRFIEFMPFPGNHYKQEATVGWKELVTKIRTKYPDIQPYDSSTGTSDTAKLYTVPNALGQFGFISTMTDIFCKTCDRLRLTADGNIRTCLHGEAEYSLRDILRQHNHSNRNDSSVLVNSSDVNRTTNGNTHFDSSSLSLPSPILPDSVLYQQLCNVIGTAVQRKHAALGGNKTPEALIKRIQNLSDTATATVTSSPGGNSEGTMTNPSRSSSDEKDTTDGNHGKGDNENSEKEKNTDSSVPQRVQHYRPMIKIGG